LSLLYSTARTDADRDLFAIARFLVKFGLVDLVSFLRCNVAFKRHLVHFTDRRGRLMRPNSLRVSRASI